MANDDRQSQQFIREVDEELRRAQLKAIWDRFAPLIIAACVLVVALTAGYRGWIWWQARQAAEAGDRFLSAVESIGGDKRAEGEAELARIAGEGGGYAALARLRLAGEKAAAGAKPEALAAYDALAADADVADSLRALARIRAALLALDVGDLEGAKERARPLDGAGNAWRHAAREVLGTAAYQGGDLAAARDFFTAIQQDAETPQDIWTRSGMMVALIDGQLVAPGVDPAPAPATPASGPAADPPVPSSGATPEPSSEPAPSAAAPESAGPAASAPVEPDPAPPTEPLAQPAPQVQPAPQALETAPVPPASPAPPGVVTAPAETPTLPAAAAPSPVEAAPAPGAAIPPQ